LFYLRSLAGIRQIENRLRLNARDCAERKNQNAGQREI